ncbi:hypothetical protein XENTR_v10018464 [Xenopus tropicalis]|uniref:Calsyntenin-2 n=1 Tax=Xenopus tropicalis TaxID=8364 RepID=A0A6I8QAH9_XENTR|nr:calsyntenin-1 [Xenopus tropicalis]KAE8591485.1 hypothetical protein XENTR_v10018464 [Xenopus tropicalis]|eukprot:XP_002940356.2 PREDICTED: calsyntenin-1 isoform X2 [Xenopus tropicalis]
MVSFNRIIFRHGIVSRGSLKQGGPAKTWTSKQLETKLQFVNRCQYRGSNEVMAGMWHPPACLLLLVGFVHGIWGVQVNKHKPWIETAYHGIVTENDNAVLLDPPLIALDKDSPLQYAGEICGFKIHDQDVPFEALVVDRSTGEGLIRSTKQLDCEIQKDYTFSIQAYDCGKGPDSSSVKKSHKASVHIQVNDVNEYAPVFKEKSYKVTVREGKKYDNILRVEAVDADCSPQFSQICSYEIVTPDVPFTIDKDGFIKNTEKLIYEKEHQYKLTVTAYDCGKKRAAEDILVKVSVKPTCKVSWQGWNKRIEYEPGSGSLSLFPGMHLETCDEPITSITAHVQLETSHIGKGCDRDTYSEKSIHKLCGSSSDVVELLPSPSMTTNWTLGLPTDNGHESDQVFEFNGTQAVKIPDEFVTLNFDEPFVISVWMRHGTGGKEKESVLCFSGKTEISQHHYFLYIHNCKLGFLLHQVASEEIYKPAEFNWKLNQACDKEWHHYVLNVELTTVTLYVDGVLFEPSAVTEDYPMHPYPIYSQLVVGACWEGDERQMGQFFSGNLAGLMIHSGKLENKKVIDCLYTCKEGLELHTVDGIGEAVKINLNTSRSDVTLEGNEIDKCDQAMQQVSYVNSRQFPTPGMRRFTITTSVRCFNEETCITIPDVEGYIIVLQPEEPRISIKGIDHFARSASEFESNGGVPLFPELHIISTITREIESDGEDPTVQESLVSEEIVHDLDTCEVVVMGEELNPGEESLQLDVTHLQQTRIEISSSNYGISLTGIDSMENYEELLHLIRYRNWNTVSLFDRKFKLICSELNGRYISNEFHVEVNVIHTASHVEVPNHIMAQPQFVHPMHPLFGDLTGHNIANPHASSVVPSAATIVIVVCVSFLVFMIILGVFRIRVTHQRALRDQEGGKENEMDWDDSALTITVNPMETYEGQQSSGEEEDSEEGDDDDITSAESECSEEEDEEQEGDQQNINKQQQLEWDDSTLTF